MTRVCILCRRPAYWCACAIVFTHPLFHAFESGAMDALVVGCMGYISAYRGE